MAIIFFTACSSTKKAMVVQTGAVNSADNLSGLEIIKSSDCITCHSFSEKLIGPSFSAIATKYDTTMENVDRLSKKIINGGSGSWGQLPMTPHSSMTDQTAKTVIKYILSLKK